MTRQNQNLTREVFLAEVRAVDENAKTVDAVISTMDVDRHRTVFLPTAWDRRLDSYRENPVLLWGHPTRLSFAGPPPPENLIGRALEIGSDGEEFRGQFQYAVDKNPRAAQVFDLIVGGYLRAYSHGSIIHGVIYDDAPEEVLATLPPRVREALQKGECWEVYSDAELLEVSNCYVGSNRKALARAAADGVISRDFADEILRGEFGRSANRVAKGLSVEEFAALADRTHDAVGRIEAAAARLEALARAAEPPPTTEPEAPSAPTVDPAEVRAIVADALRHLLA